MERTKKEENLIITYFVIFLILLIWVLIVFFSYIFPNIKRIEEIKDESLNVYETFVRVQTKWMNFREFKESINKNPNFLISWEEKSEYLNEIVNSVDEEFFDENLSNKWWWIYSAFLKEQSEKIQEWSPLEKKNEIVSRILPEYSEIVSDLWKKWLTDFEFVNYIESILETFSLTMGNRVWISDVTLLSDYSVWVLDTSLETNIYYIPLKLSLSWKRADVLDFLYFASNVWKIEIEEWELKIDSDIAPEFRSSFRGRYLKWQWTENNIFNNQIFDIELISFRDYIDPMTTVTDKYINNPLVTYIKGTNFSEESRYEIEVNLRFYIKWLPIYKIENYIKSFIQDFNRIKSETITNAENKKLNTVDRKKMLEINNTLWQLSRSVISEIERDMSSKDTINNAFNIVMRYRETLDEFQNNLDQININLWNIQK